MITDKLPPKIEKEVDCECFLRETVKFCLQKDPQKRPTTSILLENSFFRKIDAKAHMMKVVSKIRGFQEIQTKKIEVLPQPKQLTGEDPNEMLISDNDDDELSDF